MKKVDFKILCLLALMTSACTSGKNAPADSHPGSGSMKDAPHIDKSNEADTSKSDTTNKK
jgi:hypothetical protein